MTRWIAQRPRQVGVCLKALPSADSGMHFNSSTVPWQRVINAKGMISHRYARRASFISLGPYLIRTFRSAFILSFANYFIAVPEAQSGKQRLYVKKASK